MFIQNSLKSDLGCQYTALFAIGVKYPDALCNIQV